MTAVDLRQLGAFVLSGLFLYAAGYTIQFARRAVYRRAVGVPQWVVAATGNPRGDGTVEPAWAFCQFSGIALATVGVLLAVAPIDRESRSWIFIAMVMGFAVILGAVRR